MRSIAELLPGSQGIAHRNALLARGISPRQLDSALRSGHLARVRRGWYANPGADPRVVAAVRVGGSLTCVSALELAGVWVQPSPRLHVSVGRNASRLRLHGAESTVHWRPRPGARERSVDTVAEALAVASGCLSREFALVAIDCALNRKLVSLAQLRMAFAGHPGAALLESADPNSQSGLETLSRVRLRSKRVGLQTQVKIPGVGWIDVLIGERLVLELDGYGYHATGEAFETDRKRDLALHARGYRVVRLSYRQVMFDWPEAERVILSMMRRGEHRWPRRGRSATPRSAIQDGAGEGGNNQSSPG